MKFKNILLLLLPVAALMVAGCETNGYSYRNSDRYPGNQYYGNYGENYGWPDDNNGSIHHYYGGRDYREYYRSHENNPGNYGEGNPIGNDRSLRDNPGNYGERASHDEQNEHSHGDNQGNYGEHESHGRQNEHSNSNNQGNYGER